MPYFRTADIAQVQRPRATLATRHDAPRQSSCDCSAAEHCSPHGRRPCTPCSQCTFWSRSPAHNVFYVPWPLTLDLSHFHKCFVYGSVARNLVPRGFEHLSIAGANARHQALPPCAFAETVKHEHTIRPDFRVYFCL